MIISIDSGNKNIKTKHFIFPASLSESTSDIGSFGGLSSDILQYNGVYYSLDGDEREDYKRDKTDNSNYYILAIFGIAKELDEKIRKSKNPNRTQVTQTITLLNGMPPKHLSDKKAVEQFKNYFIRDKEPAIFTFRGITYKIIIEDAIIYPQAYAIMPLMRKKALSSKKLLIIDMGGWTCDYMVLTNGRYNMGDCQSLERGINKFYNIVSDYFMDHYGDALSDDKIDSILKGTFEKDYGKKIQPDVKSFVETQAQAFCNKTVNIIKERVSGITTMPIVLAGGGAVSFKKYLENNPILEDAEFIADPRVNAIGYEELYKLIKKYKKE